MLGNGNAESSFGEIMIENCTKKYIWMPGVKVLVQIMIYSCIKYPRTCVISALRPLMHAAIRADLPLPALS